MTVFVAGLAAVGAMWVGGPTLFAQFPRGGPADARIVSGDDIGFRIEGTDLRSGAPIGTWMLRVRGAWIEIGSIPVIKPAK